MPAPLTKLNQAHSHCTYITYTMATSPINNPVQRVIIACPTVIEEMNPYLSSEVATEVLDFGLHANPVKLHQTLQTRIDAIEEKTNIIILGYGMCSNAALGLSSQQSTLVIPRVSDCIALFLGSSAAYARQTEKEVGTYYLTKGWIEVCDTPLDEHRRLVARYGEQKADRMMDLMFAKYKRLAYIETGLKDQDRYKDHTRMIAEQFKLKFENIQGSSILIKKLVHGPWDEDFIVAPPRKAIEFSDFYRE